MSEAVRRYTCKDHPWSGTDDDTFVTASDHDRVVAELQRLLTLELQRNEIMDDTLAAKDAEIKWLVSCNTTHMDQMRAKDASIAALKSELSAASARLGEMEADVRTPQTAREDLERGAGAWLTKKERRLRKMLAFAYSGSNLYGDDGELHDARFPFPIDYMRDSVDQIEVAIYNRGMAALAAAQADMAEGKT